MYLFIYILVTLVIYLFLYHLLLIYIFIYLFTFFLLLLFIYLAIYLFTWFVYRLVYMQLHINSYNTLMYACIIIIIIRYSFQ